MSQPHDPSDLKALEHIRHQVRQLLLRRAYNTLIGQYEHALTLIEANEDTIARLSDGRFTARQSPPAELIHALRAPRGKQYVIKLHVRGKAVRVVVNPNGRPDPDSERRTWKRICDLVLEVA